MHRSESLAQMTAHKKPGSFLKALLLHLDREDLFWHRTVVTRLHEECRRLVLALAQSQLKLPATPSPAVLDLAPSPLNYHENHH